MKRKIFPFDLRKTPGDCYRYKNKSPAPHFSLRQRVFYSVSVLSHAAQGYIMQLVMPSVVPMAVRMVTSVWIMVFQIVFLSIFFN